MSIGRPSEYSEKTLTLARKYIDSCVDTQEKVTVEENEINGAVKFKYIPKVKIPTIEGLALALHITRETIYDWEGKFDEFSDIVKELRHKQAEVLISGGLSGQYNPLIAKVLLTKHGYREGTEVSGTEGGPVKLDTGMDEVLKKVYGTDRGTSKPSKDGGSSA